MGRGHLEAEPAHRESKSNSGQSLVEVAIALPLLLLLAVGVIEIGRYAYISILVGNAARAGAAFASQNANTAAQTSNIATAAYNDFGNNLPGINPNNASSYLNVTSTYYCECDNNGTITLLGSGSTCQTSTCPASSHELISVEVDTSLISGTITTLFNYPGLPNSISASGQARLRIGK